MGRQRPVEPPAEWSQVVTPNSALRFFLELCALAALGVWGFTVGDGTLAKVLLGVGAPLAAAVAWGTFVAPRAWVKASSPARLLVEALVFGSAALALLASGHPVLSAVFAALVVVHEVVRYVGARGGRRD